MKIFLGADHRGFEMKGNIKDWLTKKTGYKVVDLGASVLDPEDDYTTFASRVAISVAENKENDCRGILFCGSGVGVEVVANKFDGVRAAMAKEPEQVRAGRRDDNFNVLVIAADFTKVADAKKMIKVFLETSFSRSGRHKRRLSDIEKIEKIN